MSFTRHHVVLDLDDFSPDRESNCLDWLFELLGIKQQRQITGKYNTLEQLKIDLTNVLLRNATSRKKFRKFTEIKNTILNNLEANKLYRTSLGDFLFEAEDGTFYDKSIGSKNYITSDSTHDSSPPGTKKYINSNGIPQDLTSITKLKLKNK